MVLKFFVSYTQKDRAWAEWIAWQIEDAGHEARIQAWDFAPGSNFVSEMDTALKWADVTLPLLSPDFANSEFGEAEWTAAFAEDPLGSKGRLIPIRVREIKPEGLLAARVYIDLVGRRQEEARAEVLTVLERGRRKPGSEPDFPGNNLEGPPNAEPRFPPRIPTYTNNKTRSLTEQLKEAQKQHKELVRARQDTHEIRATISSLKRRLREGGSLEAGDSLGDGRFELLDPIGQGGFAHVWRAFDEEQEEEVAIKVLQSRHKKNAPKLSRFQRGARQMAKLSHPGIVRVIGEPQEDQGYHFFVMEYLEGGDFRQAVKSGRLSMEDRWRALLSIGEALHFAHTEGTIHRDIKPENILLDRDLKRAKLTDFDLVRASGQSGGTTSMLGSFVYAAPEMLHQPKAITKTVDVFGLGMTAIFALHGEDLPPLAFRNAERFLASLDCAEPLAGVLAKAVEWETEERWETVEAFCAELDSTLSSISRPAQEPTPEPAPEPQEESIRFTSDDLPELSNSWKERIKVYATLPNQIDDPDRLLSILDRLRQKTRNGNDLFHLDLAAAEVAKRWPEAARPTAALRTRLYDHIPTPPEELFRQIKTKDGRVDLWRTIPAGSFLMGSPGDESGRLRREGPQHRVEILQPFQMACVPVTQEQFAAFDPEHGSHRDGAKNPVERVNWFQAVAFCNWLSQTFPWAKGARLPIEAEWEYACRAGTTTRYWSGDDEKDLGRVGWYTENANGTHPVGEKSANPWGLYDVHGNVWEWTLGGWTGNYRQHAQGRAIDPAEINLEDPPKIADLPPPSAGSWRVIRGGSSWYDADGARAAYRFWWNPDFEDVHQGFRVALPPPARRP